MGAYGRGERARRAAAIRPPEVRLRWRVQSIDVGLAARRAGAAHCHARTRRLARHRTDFGQSVKPNSEESSPKTFGISQVNSANQMEAMVVPKATTMRAWISLTR